ncbi:MAG: hypothetical protein J1F33_05525 [Clostridiales bacterium]|nr:hypothetical protein [Clostridiales bacterium]
MKDSFIFHRKFLKCAQTMSAEKRVKYYEMIFSYAMDGIEPLVDNEFRGYFELMRDQLDHDIANWQAKSENGKKGGAPKGNQNARKRMNNANSNDNLLATADLPDKTTENNRKQPNLSETSPYVYEDDYVTDNALLLNKNINTTTICAGAREVTVEEFEREVQCEGWERYPTGEVYAEVRNTLIELINDGTIALREVNHELIGSMLNSMFQGRNRREITDLKAYLLAIIKRNNKSINGE